VHRYVTSFQNITTTFRKKHAEHHLQKNPKETHKESGQKISSDGKISIPKIGWMLRISTVMGVSAMLVYYFITGLRLQDPLIIFSTIMPLQELIVVSVGWFFYRNPSGKTTGTDLVSVLIPVFNQKSMISIVVDAIANSTYHNIEIIAVNDGSTDGTKEVLDGLKRKYPHLKVIHKKNGGKRAANATGFARAKGDFIVFIDSDSVIDQYAIEEFMKTFHTRPDVGAMVGHANVWNAKKNMLTKMQDAWYDSSFNIVKTTESTLKSVVCCSGCLSAYRREAIENFVPLWNKQNTVKSSNHSEIRYFRSNPWKSKKFAKASTHMLEWISQFDDAEDIALTSQTLVDWKSAYVSSAKVYTEVPETMGGFLKQQVRWKKGWTRTGFFLMTFFWRKNPLVSTVFYINTISSFAIPFIMPIVYIYSPFVLHQYWIPLLSLAVIVSIGVVQGLDYKFRDPTSTAWKYKPLTNIFTAFTLPWLVIPALMTFKKSQWLTR
jgi:hyaluronan synthase